MKSKQRFFQIDWFQLRSIMSVQNELVSKYSCSQLFGYKGKSQKIIEEDNITTLRFDHTGRYLALGDRAGRLIIFKTSTEIQNEQQYEYFFQYQAHEPEFDTFKNLTVGEDISHIDWLRPQGKYLRMITANSHTVKLWRLHQRSQKRITRGAGHDLMIPHLQEEQPTICANMRNAYPNQSYSPLNTVLLSNNEEYLFTADQNALFLWNLQKNSRPFLQRQLLAGSQSKLQKSQKITCAQLHRQRQSLQVLGTNKGRLNIIDSRTSIANPNVMQFWSVKDRSNFLSEIINQYSSVMFLEDSNKIATRDLISVKIWDMRLTREPAHNIYIDETIKNHVCDLFQAEVLEDSFEMTDVKGNILTGNYGNSFQMMDPSSGLNVQYELDYGQETRVRRVGEGVRKNQFNCETKVMGHDYNSATGQLAVSTRNCFFIFSEEDST